MKKKKKHVYNQTPNSSKLLEYQKSEWTVITSQHFLHCRYIKTPSILI